MSPSSLREALRAPDLHAPVLPSFRSRDVRRSPPRFAPRAFLAAALLAQVAQVGSAAADDAPPTPPAPGVAPADAPPAPQATPVTTTPVETPPSEAPEGEMLRWAGARFDWFHSATLATLGVDTGNAAPILGGESPVDAFYGQSFTFSGGVFLVERPPHQLRVSTAVSVATELTDSDTTTRIRQPDVNDIPLRLTYTPTLFSTGNGDPMKGAAALYDPTLLGKGDHRTWGFLSGEVGFPTSRRSQGTGRILSTSLGVGARQQISLLGSDAPGLTHAIVGVSGGWSHFFDKASTPVSSDLETPRQGATGTRILSDQLSGTAGVENQVGVTVSLVLSLYEGLQLSSGFGWTRAIPYTFKGSTCEVVTATGCIDLPQSESHQEDYTSFDLGLSYLVVPELAVSFGYENTASTLGEDGQGRDPFVSPSSIFYAGLSISFDRFYQRFAEPENLAALLGEEREIRAASGASGSRRPCGSSPRQPC